MRFSACLALLISAAASAIGQDAAMVYRMGRDTVAVERFRHTSKRLVGERTVRR